MIQVFSESSKAFVILLKIILQIEQFCLSFITSRFHWLKLLFFPPRIDFYSKTFNWHINSQKILNFHDLTIDFALRFKTSTEFILNLNSSSINRLLVMIVAFSIVAFFNEREFFLNVFAFFCSWPVKDAQSFLSQTK